MHIHSTCKTQPTLHSPVTLKIFFWSTLLFAMFPVKASQMLATCLASASCRMRPSLASSSSVIKMESILLDFLYKSLRSETSFETYSLPVLF